VAGERLGRGNGLNLAKVIPSLTDVGWCLDPVNRQVISHRTILIDRDLAEQTVLRGRAPEFADDLLCIDIVYTLGRLYKAQHRGIVITGATHDRILFSNRPGFWLS